MSKVPELMPDLDEHERYDPPNAEDNVFDSKPPERPSDYYCLARRQWNSVSPYPGKWGYCYARAGAGTDHKGHGRCKHHGGSTQAQAMRYAALGNPTIAELVAHFLADPDPLNLRDELAAARALFTDFVSDYKNISEALMAWHASFDKKRRDLHDKPLYNIEAIMEALVLLGGVPPKDVEQLHEALEVGVERALANRERLKLEAGVEFANDLKIEKPVKIRDIAYAVTILKVVQGLVDTIIKHEREAYLSVFAFNALMGQYGNVTRKHLVRFLKRKGVTDDEEVEELIAKIAAEWNRVPVVAESRVPRLAAEQRQRDEYLGAGPSAKA